MPLIYDHWPGVGTGLAAAHPRKYVTRQGYVANDPLEHLVVRATTPKFFGTQVLNLFVAGVPYGWAKDGSGVWQDNWPPDGLTQSVADHQATHPKFSYYRTVIFMDYNFVRVVEEDNPDSRLREMMDAVELHFLDLIPDLPGFEMGPRVETPVGPDFFSGYAGPFFAS